MNERGENMEEVVINDDEMMGFIMRQVGIEGVSMSYRDIDLILSAQMKFLREKGLVEEVDEIQTKDGVVVSIQLDGKTIADAIAKDVQDMTKTERERGKWFGI